MDIVFDHAFSWMDGHPYLGTIIIIAICATIYLCVHEIAARWSPYCDEPEEKP